ncbi:hypothetical protein Bbelb_015210 [Branchiostoma belcheri]|nr:hypothetical protein Bbelb_015210 [Branchiostoma belcheri]
MSDKLSGHGPCIPEKSHCALCQLERYVQYCAQCQRSYCQDCFKSEHQVERQDAKACCPQRGNIPSNSARSTDSTACSTARSHACSSRSEACITARFEACSTARSQAYSTARCSTARSEACSTARSQAYSTARSQAYSTARSEACSTARSQAYSTARSQAYSTARSQAYSTARSQAYSTARSQAYSTARSQACSTARSQACSTARSQACSTARSQACGTARSAVCSTARSDAYSTARCGTARSEACSTARSQACSTARPQACSTARPQACSTARSDAYSTARCGTARSEACSTARSQACGTARSAVCSTARSQACSTARSQASSTARSQASSTARSQACSTARSQASSTARSEDAPYKPTLPIPTGVPHAITLTHGAAQMTHVCSRHPGMLVQWIDIASRAGLCTKCMEGKAVQSRSTIVPYRPWPVQLMAEPSHGQNIVQTCQKHLGLPQVWYSKVQNKLLCSKCCDEGAPTEGVLSYGGIHNKLWGSYKQLKAWEERAKVATQLISNTQEHLETNIRELRGSVRVCLRHILSEVVTKLKKREESLMIQASREFTHQQQELRQLQSAVEASQQASLLTQQLVSQTMSLGPSNQKFGELMEKVQDEMEKAAAADRLVPTQVTFPTLPPFNLDQGPVNEMLLMVDSLGSCSLQPPPAAPQLLMHTQGPQVLLRWRWLSSGAAGAGRCEFELQCAILPIMVSRMHNQGHKSATVSTSNQAEVSTPNQQTVEDPNKTAQDGVTVQTIQTANMGSLGEPSKEGTDKDSKTVEELNTQLGKGATATPPPSTPQGSVNTVPTVVTPVQQGNPAVHSTCEKKMIDVIAETIEACLAKKSEPVAIRQPGCKEKETVSNKEPTLVLKLKRQQQSHVDKQSPEVWKIDSSTVNKDTSGARGAEERGVTVVREKDGDKDAVAEMEMPNRRGALPCTCSDLSAISICPAHFQLHLSSDEASSRSSDSPVQPCVPSNQTTTTASVSFLYKEQLAGSGNSPCVNGTLEETKKVAEETTHAEETSHNTNNAEPTDSSCNRKSHESKIDPSTRRCDDVTGMLMEMTRPNTKQQVSPPRSVPQPVESVRVVFTGEDNGYSSYRLECGDPSTTSGKSCETLSTTCATVGITSDPSLSSNPFHVLVPSNTKETVGGQDGVSKVCEEVVRHTDSRDILTGNTASKDNSMASGRHATSVPKGCLQTGTVPSRDNSRVEPSGQQNPTFGREETKIPNVALQTATVASEEDPRFEQHTRPTLSNDTNQSGDKTPTDKPQQMKPSTSAVTAPPGPNTGPYREDIRPKEQTTETTKQTPSVPNRSFRTIYIGPAFQHSLLVETSGVVYVFRVRASNAGGCGPWSNAVQHTYSMSRHPRQGKKAVERGTQTPEILAHLGSPRKSPAQQRGRGKRKTILLDTSSSKMSKVDAPNPALSSGKSGGFHSRMHERLLVRANMQGSPTTKKSRPSESKAKDPPQSNSNARKNKNTPKKRKADQDDSVPPKQVKGAQALSDQCREAWQNLGSPKKSKPTSAKENETMNTSGKETTPSLPVEYREAWQNLANSTPKDSRTKKTPSMTEEWDSPITREMGKPSSLKKGRSNKRSDKTPLKVRWSFPKAQQSSDIPVVSRSGGSCVSKEDARYAVTAVTNLVDALNTPGGPNNVELDVDKDVDNNIQGTPKTPKSTTDKPSSSKRRRRQSDPSPSRRAAGRTPQTPASLKQRRAPDYFEECEAIVRAVFDHPDGKLFQLPVKVKEVPDYYDIVKDPMDLDCIKKRLRELYYIIMPDQFLADMKKVFRNCHLYNKPDSEVGQAGCRLESYFVQLLHQYLPTVSYQPVYKVPAADGSLPVNKPVVQGKPEECCPAGGFSSVVQPNMEKEKRDVFCVTSENVPSAADDVATRPEEKIPGTTQQADFVEKRSVEQQGKLVGSEPVEAQENPDAEEVADMSQHANGDAFHDPATAQGSPTSAPMSKNEEISMPAPEQESSERNTASMRLEEGIQKCMNVLQGAEVEVSQRVHGKSDIDGTGTTSDTESAESGRNDDSLQISTDKPAAQSKKRREKKDNPYKHTSDEEIGDLEPWLSYRGEFAVISNPISTDATGQVTDSTPQHVSLQPLRSLSSPSLAIVSDEGDAVMCRNRQRSISAAQDLPVRPTNPALPNVNNRHCQMTLTALRSPNKNPVVASCQPPSPHQDQVTVSSTTLQGGDAVGSKPSHLKPFGQGVAQVDVVGVLVSENSTVASFQKHGMVEGYKSLGSPSRQDPLGSDNKTTVGLTQKCHKDAHLQESSTKPKRYQKARKSYPQNVPHKMQVHSNSNQPISSHLVSGDEQQPITSQPSSSSAKSTGAVDSPVVRKDAPVFPGKVGKKPAHCEEVHLYEGGQQPSPPRHEFTTVPTVVTTRASER